MRAGMVCIKPIMHIMSVEMESLSKPRRRVHSDAFKREPVERSLVPRGLGGGAGGAGDGARYQRQSAVRLAPSISAKSERAKPHATTWRAGRR